MTTGHGNQKAPAQSPSAASPARTPAPIRAIRRLRSSRPSGWSAVPSSGTSNQPAAYSRRPEPPKKTSTTSATRTMIGSTSR